MTEAEQREMIVAEARKWIKTPYHPSADVLGAGVDCGMMLVRVFVDTGLVPAFDPRPYPPDWHMHRSEERYLGSLETYLHKTETPQIGDVMVFRYGRCYSHGGVITSVNPLTIVHAFMPYSAVIEEPVSFNLELCRPERNPLFFSFWNTDGVA